MNNQEPPKKPRKAWANTTGTPENDGTRYCHESSDSGNRTHQDRSSSEPTGQVATPLQTPPSVQHPGGGSTWYVNQHAPIAQFVSGSEFEKLSKVLELLKDPKTLLKTSNEEISKTVSTIDCAFVQSEIHKVATIQKQLDEQRKELDFKSHEIIKLEAKCAELEAKRKADDERKVKKGNQQKEDVHQPKIKMDNLSKKIEALMKENKTLKEDKSRIQGELRKIVKEKEQLSDELTETKNRLSRLMGDRLTDGNAEIADLSDENRPTKIAEKYSELYDNKWTDAYELLQTHGLDEKSIIAILLETLQSIKYHCNEMSSNWTTRLIDAITMNDPTEKVCAIPDNVNKQIKYLKKISAGVSVARVFDAFMKDTHRLQPTQSSMSILYYIYKAINESAMIAYINECISVCWLMCVQDPPLVMEWDMKHADPFNSNALKVYTETGPALDFLVWPPLHLKADGPLLSRGVAQGMPIPSSDSGSREPQQLNTSTSTGYVKHIATKYQTASIPATIEPQMAVSKEDEHKRSPLQNKCLVGSKTYIVKR